MKLHTMQSNLKALDPAMTFTAAQILRTLDYAVEEVDTALKLVKRRHPTSPSGCRNANRTPEHLELTVLHLRDKGYIHREIASRLDMPTATVNKICAKGGV